MNKFLRILMVGIMAALILTSCSGKNGGQSGEDSLLPADQSDDIGIDDDEFQERKYDKAAAMELLLNNEQLRTYVDASNPESFGFEDITPNVVYNKTKAQLFKASEEYEGFLIADDSMYHIGKASGGFGISYADVSDFDDNGKADIIYMYSYQDEGGKFTIEIASFDMALKTEKVLYTYESADGYCELMLEKASDSSFFVYTTVANNTDDDNASFVKDELIAEIMPGGIVNNTDGDQGTEWAD